MSKLQGYTIILAFRGVIVFSLSIYTIQKVFEIVVMFKRQLYEGIFWKVLSDYMYPGVQFLLSLSFFVVGNS